MIFSKSLAPPKWQEYCLSLVLVAAWLWGNFAACQWLWQSLQHASTFNLLLVIAVVALGAVQLWKDRFWQEVALVPKLRVYPVVLMLGCAVAGIAGRWLADIPQINLLLFLLGSYGLWGLFITSSPWRKGLVTATLIACILPFATQFNSGLGFPVRVLTAHAVERILAAWQISAISSHDVIVLENGIAQVDLPCSGLKSLWTGTIFLLAATWLERRKLGWRWLGVSLVQMLLLIISNITRVLLLVLLIEVWQQPQIAQILHLPLGILGFIFSCGLGWLLLRFVPLQVLEGKGKTKQAREWKDLGAYRVFVAVMFCLAIVAQIQPLQRQPMPISQLQLPQQIITEPLLMSEAEQRFFDNPAQPIAEKKHFEFGSLSGSMLLVASNAWQAHHPPELCFVGNGLKVDHMEAKLLANSVQARWLSLQNGALSATYWFQSPQSTTDDFLTRIWDYVAHRQKTWVLVSVLFDAPQTPSSPEVQTFASVMHDAIFQSLNP